MERAASAGSIGPVSVTEMWVRSADVALHCFDTGADRPPVVIVHGLAGSAQEFVPTAMALPEFRTVLLDQRGHGLSTPRPPDVSRAAFVADLVQLLEVLDRPATLVGQSMGAHTAMLTAASRPDRVQGLVLLEGGPGGEDPAGTEQARSYFRSWPVPFRSEQVAADFLGHGPLARIWLASLRQREDGWWPPFEPDVMVGVLDTLTSAYWAEWERVSVPTLAVYAEHGMFTETQKAEFVRRGQHVQRVDLAGASHDAHLDAFHQWILALRTFLLQPTGT